MNLLSKLVLASFAAQNVLSLKVTPSCDQGFVFRDGSCQPDQQQQQTDTMQPGQTRADNEQNEQDHREMMAQNLEMMQPGEEQQQQTDATQPGAQLAEEQTSEQQNQPEQHQEEVVPEQDQASQAANDQVEKDHEQITQEHPDMVKPEVITEEEQTRAHYEQDEQDHREMMAQHPEMVQPGEEMEEQQQTLAAHGTTQDSNSAHTDSGEKVSEKAKKVFEEGLVDLVRLPKSRPGDEAGAAAPEESDLTPDNMDQDLQRAQHDSLALGKYLRSSDKTGLENLLVEMYDNGGPQRVKAAEEYSNALGYDMHAYQELLER
eukprot:TRINITY_DN4516_c0_g1_i2.p1 TRINITY_DN4516_c0_g1~~TRINITY_DN4516_c0_g1_i2.p1  ORF type:complete len:318 (+),score=98.36 TRINITY_DN4516_c0_g1_i2:99-1052(+)